MGERVTYEVLVKVDECPHCDQPFEKPTYEHVGDKSGDNKRSAVVGKMEELSIGGIARGIARTNWRPPYRGKLRTEPVVELEELKEEDLLPDKDEEALREEAFSAATEEAPI